MLFALKRAAAGCESAPSLPRPPPISKVGPTRLADRHGVFEFSRTRTNTACHGVQSELESRKKETVTVTHWQAVRVLRLKLRLENKKYSHFHALKRRRGGAAVGQNHGCIGREN